MPVNIFDLPYWVDPRRVQDDLKKLQEAIAEAEKHGHVTQRMRQQMAELADMAELAIRYHRTGQKQKLPPKRRWRKDANG